MGWLSSVAAASEPRLEGGELGALQAAVRWGGGGFWPETLCCTLGAASTAARVRRGWGTCS